MGWVEIERINDFCVGFRARMMIMITGLIEHNHYHLLLCCWLVPLCSPISEKGCSLCRTGDPNQKPFLHLENGRVWIQCRPKLFVDL